MQLTCVFRIQSNMTHVETLHQNIDNQLSGDTQKFSYTLLSTDGNCKKLVFQLKYTSVYNMMRVKSVANIYDQVC